MIFGMKIGVKMLVIGWLVLAGLLFGDESVAWRRHSWGIPMWELVPELFLDRTVYRRFPVGAPLVARYYRDGLQKGVCLAPSSRETVVIAAFAKSDLMEAYGTQLREMRSFGNIQELAAAVNEGGQILHVRREMSRKNGERVIAVWEVIMNKCAFRPFSVEVEPWSMQSEALDGRVIEFDISDASSYRPTKQVIVVAKALMEFSVDRITEPQLMDIVEDSMAQTADLPSRVDGAVKRVYR